MLCFSLPFNIKSQSELFGSIAVVLRDDIIGPGEMNLPIIFKTFEYRIIEIAVRAK